MKGVRYLNLDINNFEIVKDKESFIEHKDIKKNFKLPKKFPIMSMVVLTIIILGCLFSNIIMTHNPKFIDLANSNVSPNSIFYFGADSMGRDIFSDISFDTFVILNAEGKWRSILSFDIFIISFYIKRSQIHGSFFSFSIAVYL